MCVRRFAPIQSSRGDFSYPRFHRSPALRCGYMPAIVMRPFGLPINARRSRPCWNARPAVPPTPVVKIALPHPTAQQFSAWERRGHRQLITYCKTPTAARAWRPMPHVRHPALSRHLWVSAKRGLGLRRSRRVRDQSSAWAPSSTFMACTAQNPASYWEIAIKISLGRYALSVPYGEFWNRRAPRTQRRTRTN